MSSPGWDPLELFLDRWWPHHLAVAIAAATAVFALRAAVRTGNPGRRRGSLALALVTGTEAGGMIAARRRRMRRRPRRG